MTGFYDQVVKRYEKDINRATLNLRSVFRENDKPRYQRGFRRGTFDEKVLTPLVVAHRIGPHDAVKVMQHGYKRRVDPIHRSYSVQVMIDASGSTSGYNIGVEKVVVAAFTEMFFRVGVDFSVVAHSGTAEEMITSIVSVYVCELDITCQNCKNIPRYYDNECQGGFDAMISLC